MIMVCAFAISDTRFTKLLSTFFILLSGSGTAYVGLVCIVMLKLNRRNFVLYACLGFIIIFAFIASQTSRGRLTGDWADIDRLVIMYSTINFLVQEFTFLDWIVGKGLNYKLSESFYLLTALFSNEISGYLLAEGLGYGSGRNFHSEHLRLLLHVGLLGWTLYWLLLRKFLQGTDLFFPIFIMSFFSSVVLITSVLLVLLLFSRSISYGSRNN
jgi:hypothetical protein